MAQDPPPFFPERGQAYIVPQSGSLVVPAEATGGQANGALLDATGPAGALLLLREGRGLALRFGSRADILALTLELLALHDALALRDAHQASAANAEIDRIMEGRSTVAGYGHA